MANDNLVSIIIPSYNAAKYIKEAVDSALAQTYKNLEIVVVDDGSTDDTKTVLESYVASGRIRYIYQGNKGLAGARNTGIRAAKGDYIAFLDADDLFLPDKVAEQIRVFEENPEYRICYSDLLHFSEDGQTYHHRYQYPSGDVFEPLLHRQLINPLTVMVERKMFEKYGFFDETLRRSEDWDLWLRWAHAGEKFYYLNKPLARYRIRSAGNLSSADSEPEMKEKNLWLFSRFGQRLSKEEQKRYKFGDVLRLLRFKAVFAHLLVGQKNVALLRAKELPFPWRVLIYILPGVVWKFILVFARRVKHRLLLKKI